MPEAFYQLNLSLVPVLNFWRIPHTVLHRGCSTLPAQQGCTVSDFSRVHYLRTKLNSPGTKVTLSADTPGRAPHYDSHKATQSIKQLGGKNAELSSLYQSEAVLETASSAIVPKSTSWNHTLNPPDLLTYSLLGPPGKRSVLTMQHVILNSYPGLPLY